MIVDGPPGIGCPVIASVTGADLVLAITEPTVSGSHDLERLARLVKGFDLPLVVCINKSDLNPDMAVVIRDLCAAHGVEVGGRACLRHGGGRSASTGTKHRGIRRQSRRRFRYALSGAFLENKLRNMED